MSWSGPRATREPSPPYKKPGGKKLTKVGKKLKKKISSKEKINKSNRLIVPKFKTSLEATRWIKANDIAKSVGIKGVNLEQLTCILQKYVDLREEYGMDSGKHAFVLDEIRHKKSGSSSFYPGHSGGYKSRNKNRLTLGWTFKLDPEKAIDRFAAKEAWEDRRKYKSRMKKRIEKYTERIEEYKKADPSSKNRYDREIHAKIKRDLKKMKRDVRYPTFSVEGDRKGRNVNHVLVNAEETIIHEFGHILENQLIGTLLYGSKGYKNTLLNAKLVAMWKDRKQPKNDVTKISKYADRNIHEYFAEGFTQYYTDKSRPLPKNMASYIRRVKRVGVERKLVYSKFQG